MENAAVFFKQKALKKICEKDMYIGKEQGEVSWEETRPWVKQAVNSDVDVEVVHGE
jgi:hypothetical protein